MNPQLNLYNILGIESNATREIIRQAWRRKVLQWHPDKREPGDPDAERVFKDIQKAYETLSNDMTRSVYDDALSENESEDITSFIKCSALQTGTRYSEEFERLITRWIDEYSTRTFVDNVDDEMNTMIKELLTEYDAKLKVRIIRKRCELCHEYHYDTLVHNKDKEDVLIKFLSRYNNSTLDEYLQFAFHNEWEWKPVEKTSAIIKELWLSKKWFDLENMINNLATPLKILKETLKTKVFSIDESLKSIVQSISNIQPIKYLPDVREYIELIEYEHRTHKHHLLKESGDSDYYHNASGSICIVEQTDRSNVLSKLMFRIERLPIPAEKMDCVSCQVCRQKFNVWRRKHRCRMCGNIQCSGCEVWQTCRHLGYIQPVRICLPCSRRRHILIAQVLSQRIERLIIDPYSDYIHIYLALLYHYAKDGDYKQIYQRASRYFWYKNDFSRVLQCYQYFASEQDWIQLAEQLSDEHSNYEYAAASLATISKRDHTYWIVKGNAYFEKNQPILGLLSYRQASLHIDKIWSALTSSIHDVTRMYLSYYTQCEVEKMACDIKLRWIQQMRQQLKDDKLRPFVIRQLQLANLSDTEWYDILEELMKVQDYVIASEILCARYPYSQEFTHPFLRCATVFLRDSTVPVDEWMNNVENIDQTLMNIAFISYLLPSVNWTDLQTEYLKNKIYIGVMLCHKVRTILYSASNVELTWIEDGLHDNEPIAYELKQLTACIDWEQLAMQYIHMDDNQRAMRFNCLRIDSSNSVPATTESVLKFAHDYLSPKQALQCALYAYKQAGSDIACLIVIIQFLVSCCHTSESVINIIARVVCSIKNIEHRISLYVILLEELAKHEVLFYVYDACLHIVAGAVKAKEIINNHPKQVQANHYKLLQDVLHQSIVSLARVLISIHNPDVLEEILRQCFNEQTLSNTQAEFQAKMHLIIGVRNLLQNQYVNAVGSFHSALTCHPSPDTRTALLLFLQDTQFTRALLSELIFDLGEMKIEKLGVFGCDIEPPPTVFSKETHLKQSDTSTFIRRYERAILKQRNISSKRMALSYIDMCDGTHDPTLIVSNLLLAAIHFYNELLKQRQHPELVYAYRQSIEKLCSHAYHLTIGYLSPPVQQYAYRLMVTLLCRAISVFREVTRLSDNNRLIQDKIISRRCVGLLSRLLSRTIHLTNVSPLMNIPVSLTYDIIYLEIINEKFLVEYLDIMSQKEAESALYHYYILEGIWRGWMDDRNFMDARRISMEKLLATRKWNMVDVQTILQVSVIPRSTDGWQYSERLPLNLKKGPLCFQRAHGIAVDMKTARINFLFQPAAKPNDGLFDANDVIEILQGGLTSAFFSLDPIKDNLLYHPFQQMRYKPYALVNTRYLATMFHVDYLLKMFTIGVETNAHIPFVTRSINDGFIKRLPEHLREKLCLWDKNYDGPGHLKNISHRFWIQPDDVNFVMEPDKHDSNKFLMRVGEVRLRVKKRRLVYNIKGELVDDEDEDLDDQQSPESKFVKAFNENYDEIGQYFPELLRLKELLKLGIILIFIRKAYDSLARPTSVDSLSESFTSFGRSINYPHATYANESIEYNDTLQYNDRRADEVSLSEELRVKSEIHADLKRIDEDIVDHYTKEFCNVFDLNDKYTVEKHVTQWLESKRSESLATFIADSLNSRMKMRLKAIEELNIKLHDNDKG